MAAVLESVVIVEGPEKTKERRTKECATFVRMFYSFGKHASPIDYRKKSYPPNELQIYVWMDSNLTELALNLRMLDKSLNVKGATYDFQFVTKVEERCLYAVKNAGCVTLGEVGPDDFKTLAQCRFLPGDYIDVNVTIPRWGKKRDSLAVNLDINSEEPVISDVL